MRDQWNLLAMAGWRMDDVITKENVLELVSRQQGLNFDPGDEYNYCNTGFTLLAEVVSRVSGQTFAEFTEENIFKPLGMSNTLFYDDHEKIVENRAYSYHKADGGYKKSILSFANVGATSLFTTVEDLSLWAINFQTLKIGNVDIIDQMNSKAVLNDGTTFGGALGQFVDEYKGLNQIQHGGSDAGYRSYIGRFPDQDFAVVVFSNYAGSNSAGLSLRVADIFLEEHFVEVESTQLKEREYLDLSKEQLEKCEGDYWNTGDRYSRKIYVKNDTLQYFRNENSESPLVPVGKHEFKMLNVDVDLIVRFDSDGSKQNMVVTVDDGDPVTFMGYEPVIYSSAELNEYVGTYYSEELGTPYSLILKEGKLYAKHMRTGLIEFEAVMKDFFTGNKWYFGSIEFDRANNNAIKGMRVSSGRVRDLWFEKQEEDR